MAVEVDVLSLLTNISECESTASTPRSVCLHVDSRVLSFQRNDDPNIKNYMETNVEKIGWEKYKFQCKKFGIPPIQAIRQCLNGEFKLNLGHYIPQSIGVAYAFEALCDQENMNLTHINLTNCPMTQTGCITLSEFIRRNKSLQYLNLRNTKIGWQGIDILDAGLFINQSIKYINLSGCCLGDKGLIILAKTLNGNDVCKHLDVSHNNLYIESGEALKAILMTTSLEVVDFGWNELYVEKTVEKVFQGLRSSCNIKEFIFSWNGLSGTSWVKSFQQALAKCGNLEKLNIENNRLTGADQIMLGVQKSKSLKMLYLGSNPWTTQDYEKILSSCMKATKLKVLSLGSDTYLTAECVQMAVSAIEKNPHLTVIFKGQLLDRPLNDVDFKKILIDRLKALAMKPKKKKLQRNMGHFFLKLKEENIEYDERESFIAKLTSFGAKLDAELIEQVADEWTVELGIKKKKVKRVALFDMCDLYLSIHPTEAPIIVEKKMPTEGKKGGKVAKSGKDGKSGKGKSKTDKKK